jgi:hypothetical protein
MKGGGCERTSISGKQSSEGMGSKRGVRGRTLGCREGSSLDIQEQQPWGQVLRQHHPHGLQLRPSLLPPPLLRRCSARAARALGGSPSAPCRRRLRSSSSSSSGRPWARLQLSSAAAAAVLLKARAGIAIGRATAAAAVAGAGRGAARPSRRWRAAAAVAAARVGQLDIRPMRAGQQLAVILHEVHAGQLDRAGTAAHHHRRRDGEHFWHRAPCCRRAHVPAPAQLAPVHQAQLAAALDQQRLLAPQVAACGRGSSVALSVCSAWPGGNMVG